MDFRTETVTVTKHTLELTDDEVKMLAALADFPSWSAQPKEAKEFLKKLHGALHEGHSYRTADEFFVPKTSFGGWVDSI